MNAAIYNRRRAVNGVIMVLAWFAAASGIFVLALILGTLLYKGLGGVSWAVFSQNTPPPGSAGGLLNAIYGSVMMTLIGTALGTPIGILAGTYMAEYGRGNKLTWWCASSTTSCCRHP